VAIVLGEENLWFRFYIRCLPLLVLWISQWVTK
jgi:hypothetical protein